MDLFGVGGYAHVTPGKGMLPLIEASPLSPRVAAIVEKMREGMSVYAAVHVVTEDSEAGMLQMFASCLVEDKMETIAYLQFLQQVRAKAHAG